MLEGIAGPPDYLAMAAPFAGDRQRELMLGHRHVAQCGLMVSRPLARPGRERARPRPSSATTSTRTTRATFHAGLRRLAELMWAAGARRVVLPVARVPELRDGDSAPLRDARPAAARSEADGLPPARHRARARATRARRRRRRPALHGVHDVHVADGSAVPGPLGVNPQITIMALATRLAHHLLETEVPACRS